MKKTSFPNEISSNMPTFSRISEDEWISETGNVLMVYTPSEWLVKVYVEADNEWLISDTSKNATQAYLLASLRETNLTMATASVSVLVNQ